MKKIFILIFFTFLLSFAFSNNAQAIENGDFNGDEKVDNLDYDILVANFENPYTIFDYNTLVQNYDSTLGFSDLSSTLASETATFTFTYTGTPTTTFTIDMSIDPNMRSDVYGSYGQGSSNPITVTDPKKWDQYNEGRRLYWTVKTQDYESSIQSACVSFCPTPYPTPNVTDIPITRNVMVIEYNPIIENSGNSRLTEVLDWGNAKNMTNQYITDMKGVSGGYLNYQIVSWKTIDDIPQLVDGFHYTDETFLSCYNNHTLCHKPDTVNYQKVLASNNVCEKRNNGTIDELWVWNGPYFGFYEAVMAGDGAFNTNGTPIYNTACEKPLHIMGFSAQTGASEMLENMGHRIEGTMVYIYGTWESHNPISNWDKFTATDHYAPSKTACGGIHYAPNSTTDYDWNNTRYVNSTCNDWLNFPNLTGAKESLNCSVWECNGYGFKKWWLKHLPHKTGRTDGKWNNWWKYVVGNN